MRFKQRELSKVCGNCEYFKETQHGIDGICLIKRKRDEKESRDAFDRNEYPHHPEFYPSGEPWQFIYMMSRNCFVEYDDECTEE